MPTPDRPPSRRLPAAPILVAAIPVAPILVAAWFLLLYVLPPLGEYARFRLSNFDFGMVFQSSDLLSRAEALFMTCRGVHVWADNQDYLQLVFAPFHWLARPHQALLVAHSLAAFAPGAFCLAYLWRRGPGTALGTAVLAWASPFMVNMNMDLLHTEALATIVLLGLYLAAKRGRVAAFYVALLAALAAKEDVALSTGLLLLLFSLEARRFRLPRAHFAAGLGLSVVVFFVNLELVLPYYKLATCLWLDPRASLESMDSVPAALAYQQVLENWYRPAFLAGMLLRPKMLVYAASLAWPLLFFLRRPTLLWLGPAAGLFVNGVSSSGHLISGYYHYDYCTFAAVLIAVLEGLERHPRPARAAAGLACVALGVNLVSPLRTELYAPLTPAFWDLAPAPQVRLLEELDLILPADTVISADRTTLCYLLEGRNSVFMFKNPFQTHFFGLYDQCTTFAVTPAVDLVILERGLERRLDAVTSLLPADFRRLPDAGAPFLVWVSPDFDASAAGRATRALLAGGAP